RHTIPPTDLRNRLSLSPRSLSNAAGPLAIPSGFPSPPSGGVRRNPQPFSSKNHAHRTITISRIHKAVYDSARRGIVLQGSNSTRNCVSPPPSPSPPLWLWASPPAKRRPKPTPRPTPTRRLLTPPTPPPRRRRLRLTPTRLPRTPRPPTPRRPKPPTRWPR